MNKRDTFKNLLSYGTALVLIILLTLFLSKQKEQLEIISSISFTKLILPIYMSIITYTLTNAQYSYYLKHKEKVSMDSTDKLTLAHSMTLFGYIIPVKGGLLYSLLLYKLKYKIRLDSGISIGMFMYFITFVFTGIYGLFFSLYTGDLSPILIASSALLLFSPVLLVVTDKYLSKWEVNAGLLFINKIINFVQKVTKNIKESLTNKEVVLFMIAIKVLKLAINCAWYFSVIDILGMEYNIPIIILFVLLRESILIFKVTPGNIGVDELLVGGLVSLLGGILTDGVIISLVVRTTVLITVIPVGLIGIIKNRKYIHELKFIKESCE